MSMKKIAVICSTNYNDYPLGGMMSFIRDAAPALSDSFDIHFWGVDAGRSPTEFTSAGRTFPVRFFARVKKGRKVVPNMIRVVWGLYRRRREILDAGYDGVYIHGIPLNFALPSSMVPRRINHVHGLNNPFRKLGANTRARSMLFHLYEYIRRKAVRESHLVLLAADTQGLHPFAQLYPTAGKLVSLPNFCDTTIFNVDVQPIDKVSAGIKASDRIILFVGRLSHEKDPFLAIRIMANLRSSELTPETVKLVIIGDGSLRKEVESKAHALGIHGSIRFLGVQPRETVACWMRAADVLLVTSYFEGFPVVLAEAAQCGLAIVAVDITGIHDLVVPGVNGMLVDSRDPAAFVPAIANALANRKRYGEESLKLAVQYTPEIVLARLAREISDVL